MSKTQKTLIIAIIIVLVTLICILSIYLTLRRKGFGSEEVYEYIEEIKPEEKIAIVDIRNHYYIVQSCINKFYTYNDIISNIKEYYGGEDEEVIKEATSENAAIIYNLLDEEYIKSREITKGNLLTKIGKVNGSIVDINNMYVSEKSTNISVYIVNGTLRDKKSNNISSFKMIVKLDFANETFSIIPDDYVDENYPNVEIGGNINIEVPENIKINKNNKYLFKVVSDDTYIMDLFNKLKEELLYNTKEIYNDLNQDYKNSKFASEEEFDKYVKNKYANLKNINAESYKETKKEDYTQYIIIDSEGNYYIFREIAPMQYSLILDTYTIDIPEFVDRYNKSKAQEKVILNLNKFMLAINDKDYKTAYNMLADSFKKNNFQTIGEFEKYMKNNFFDKNKFDYKYFGDEAGTYYTYKVDISDQEEKIRQTITKNFIILLGEGTEFEISFNIK